MKRAFFFVLFLAAVIFSSRLLAAELKVNSRSVEEGAAFNLFYDDLDMGKMNFSLLDRSLKKAEISFDGGRNWEEMKSEEEGVFSYAYRPLEDGSIRPQFLLTDDKGSMTTFIPELQINYMKKRPDDAVIQVLEKLKTYYEQEQKDRFMTLFSTRFPDRIKLEDAIQNDFYTYKNIRLYYRIERRVFDDDLEGAIWDVYWQKKYQDRFGAEQPEIDSPMSMHFEKEGNDWLVTGLRNNTIFGSSLLESGTVDLNVFALNVANDPNPPAYTADVTAIIENLGSTEATAITIDYYKRRMDAPADPGYILFDTQNVASLPAASTLTLPMVTYNALALLGGNYEFRVIVTVTGDTNVGNNQRTVTFFIAP